jgi:hypothetical protein
LRCTSQRARGGGAVSQIGERRLNKEFALWTRVQHIWCDKKFEGTKAASAGEMTHRSAFRALAHQRRECCGCVTCGERGACSAERFCELRVVLAKWFWFWQERAAR